MNWVDKYSELLFSNNHEKVEQAYDLKYENLPKSLYRYRPCWDETKLKIELLKEILENKIWLSEPTNFNDPFDSVWNIDSDTLFFETFFERPSIKKLFRPEEIADAKRTTNPFLFLAKIDSWRNGRAGKDVDVVVRESNRKFEEYKNRIKSQRQKHIKVCCFSELKDSILMWSHYGSSHQGFCIEYDISKETKTSDRARFLYPVIYSNDLLDATQILREGWNKPRITPFVLKSATTKFSGWEYEKEWRLIFPHGPQRPINEKLLDFCSIRAIYLGARINESDREELAKVAGKQGIEIYQMELSSTKFELQAKLMVT